MTKAIITQVIMQKNITIVMIVCYYVTYEFQSESTLYSLPEYLGTPCSKQAVYLKFN